MTTTPTSGAAIKRYKIGYREDEWGQRSSTPGGIPDASGPWVRYEDHIAALAAGQGVAYVALPEPADIIAGALQISRGHAYELMREAVATDASHGQAPAGATLPDGWVPLTITHEGQHPEEVAYGPQIMMDRLGKWLGKYFAQAAQAADSVTAPAPPPECETEAEKRAFAFGWFKALESERMKAESVQEDALSDAVRVPLDSLHADAAYLIGRLRDGSMPYARVIEIIRERIDAAMNKGATQ